VARIEETALDLVLEDLLHFGDAQERIGRRIADRRIHVTEFAEDEEVLDFSRRIELHLFHHR
jgi:hypothetical protein